MLDRDAIDTLTVFIGEKIIEYLPDGAPNNIEWMDVFRNILQRAIHDTLSTYVLNPELICVPDHRHEFQFTISEISYDGPKGTHEEPRIVLKTVDWRLVFMLGKKLTSGWVDISGMLEDSMGEGMRGWYFPLPPQAFNDMADEKWDGTAEDVERLKPLFEGKRFRVPIKLTH